ncbi:Periplasmic thiol:disulfide oxidoreductase DsbB, required for DsbA reoxidation [Marinobacterium lacunae]|uniref:Periplasmic thiol:disulfide oxidoreductase DsbB, required for DsbA reoxidation n=1 Tax=Marinobacterium lacunae TaxID=1232683 RepID=A0A081FTT4_9GAMM|nr:disulfide bond formation protein B [Marinobacterium lacunae]KEA61939.1 Periplasmic thiol:disulfide oxidoreductase DsbB, required for DsbA reoxidation [Marinobacterium lacunae]MBR9883511.1 disulfide bond formation protein B [Oceanospirillales bacterium]
MLNALSVIARSRLFWFLVLVACLLLEGTALYYQYSLDYGPCVLCVHIRAWIAGLGAVALLMFLLGGSMAVLGHLASLALASGLLRSSWITLGVERGTIEDSCTMDPQFPSWLPLHEWVPAMFEPWEPCGYTPMLPFGMTMAEALVLIGLAWVAVSFLLLLASFRKPKRKRDLFL